MRERSTIEIEILAKYFRRAYRDAGWDRLSADAKAQRLVPLIAGKTAQPQAGRYSLVMQALADGVAHREPKETSPCLKSVA